MHPLENGLRNTKCGIAASAVPWPSVSEYQHTRLIVEESAHRINAQIPHLRDLTNGVVALLRARHNRVYLQSRVLVHLDSIPYLLFHNPGLLRLGYLNALGTKIR
jgi:hypothetical protein